jgi:hypothetical protein
MLEVPGVGGGTAVADAAADPGVGGAGGDTDEGAGAAPGGVESGTPEGGGEAPAAGDAGTDEPAPDLDAEPEADFDPEAEGIDADGRKLDLKTREALAAFKKANPDAAKRLAGTYFRANTIMREVGAQNLSEAVVKIRDMNATLESLGGEEGIQNLQGEVGDYRNEIQKFAEGDPAFLEELNDSGPDAFLTAITSGLEIIAAKNPNNLDRVLFPAMMARLEKSGVTGSLTTLANLIKEGKGQEAYDLTAQLAKWMNDGKNFADKQKSLKLERNPEADKLAKDRADLNQERRRDYDTKVGADVNRQNNVVTARLVEPFFKQLNLKPEGRKEFVNALNSRIYATMAKDKAFQRNANALMDKGDATRAARFVAAKFAELLPTHFRGLRNAMYPNLVKGGTKPVAGKAGAGGAAPAAKAANGALTVTVKPKAEEIDWTKTTDEMYHIGRGMGEAILTSGKRVRWDWAKV